MSHKIITETDIKGMDPHDEVVVDWDTIITPAALDAAYVKGIRIIDVREGRKPRGWGKPDPRQPGGSRMARLRDGDYLLQMRNGKPRLFEIREDGVFPVPDEELPEGSR